MLDENSRKEFIEKAFQKLNVIGQLTKHETDLLKGVFQSDSTKRRIRENLVKLASGEGENDNDRNETEMM